MNKITKFIFGVLLDFVTILFCYFIMHLVVVAYNSLFQANYDTPYTFTTIWVVLLFLPPYFILTRRGLKQEKFIAFIIGAVLLGGFSVFLTKIAYSFFIDPYKFEIIQSNYVAVSGADDVEYETMYEEGTRTETTPGFVFNRTDKRISGEKNKMQEEHGDISLKKYIFWQSAMADGYNPQHIIPYKKAHKIELLFTVAPLRIVESFFDALLNTLLFFIVPFVLRLFGKSLLSFVPFLKSKSYKSEQIRT